MGKNSKGPDEDWKRSLRQKLADRVRSPKGPGARFRVPYGEFLIGVLPNIEGRLRAPYASVTLHGYVSPMICGNTRPRMNRCSLCANLREILMKPSSSGISRADLAVLEARNCFVIQMAYRDIYKAEWKGPLWWLLNNKGPMSLGVRIVEKLTEASGSQLDRAGVIYLNVTRIGSGIDTQYEFSLEDCSDPIPDEIVKAVIPFKDLATEQFSRYSEEVANAYLPQILRKGGSPKPEDLSDLGAMERLITGAPEMDVDRVQARLKRDLSWLKLDKRQDATSSPFSAKDKPVDRSSKPTSKRVEPSPLLTGGRKFRWDE